MKQGYTGRHNIFLDDDARNIGTGRRTVDITVSRKFVRLKCPYTGCKQKLKRAAFETIASAKRNRAEFAEMLEA